MSATVTRTGETNRKTKETEIDVKLNIDGSGKVKIDTGVGFLDHMLELFGCHARFDLEVVCKGDTKVDAHHSVEDIGIVLGKLFNKLIGDKKGIARYAAVYVPMDESLARAVIDISGRPFLSFKGALKGKVGEFDAELIKEFFQAFASYAMITLHIEILYGENLHHMCEAAFKAFARALSEASKITGSEILSSKGYLE